MDTDMTDAAYDIDIDVGTGAGTDAQEPVQTGPTTDNDTAMPAAYFESLDTPRAWPEALNLQGVDSFDPGDAMYYAMEHCGADSRVKQLRWVNDSSVNLEFYSAQEAAAALRLLTHPEAGDPNSLSAQTPRRARPYSKKPEAVLTIRETNATDQKPRGAANRSNYYQRNPDIRGNREREPHRRPPPRRDFLDYDGVDSSGPRRRGSDEDSMNGDSDGGRRRNRRNFGRDNRGRGGDRGGDRGDDRGDDRSGRLRNDVDSYRPGSKSPRESRFGRLRGRSASPGSGEEGDGRYGFSEEGHNPRRRYRSRSRSRNNRRRREPSGERWTHDRATYGDRGGDRGDRGVFGTPQGGRWTKDLSFDASPMSNHRRSDATDETNRGKGASLLSRMTKDGQPLQQPTRSLASRITREGDDDESSYGRLKNDDSEPWDDNGFSDPAPSRGLASRITRDDDINIRGRSQEGINIRGTASNANARGINIRGVASGT